MHRTTGNASVPGGVWLLLTLVGTALGARELKAAEPLQMTEFLAENANSLLDGDGDSSDWIELRNTTSATLNVGGWSLTDDPETLNKWTLPSTNLAAGGYLIVFASGKDRRVPGQPLHANFALSKDGEYLALVRPDGETVAQDFGASYPPQVADESYGLNPLGEVRFFRPPTPGTANAAGFADRVADTRFNVDRGFFNQPFDLVIRSDTPEVEIRYTLNGAPPTATTGQVYTGPIRITGTTSVRAAAFRAGWLPSNVDTHTYLFTADIIRQSPTGAAPSGWPTSWGSNSRDYGMDPDVVEDPRYRDQVEAALRALPSFCVTMNLPDLFNSATGIYANPGQDGRAWERPMSLELVYPDGREGFQVNGGIRIRGGFSRSTSNPKHAFRFFFREEYGAGKLVYPVFGEEAAQEFDGFDLRTFQNYSWSFQGDSRGTFMRDQFNRDVQLAMGHQAERGDYYHLYINGQYWGLFNTCERPEASYSATYLGGDKDDYDVIKVEAGPYTILATDGDLRGWTQLYNAARNGVDDAEFRRFLGQNPDGTRNPDYPVYVDPDNLIDYMLVILWGGNLDAPISNFLGNTSPNNFFGVWNRVTADRGFQFFVHDAEHTLLDVNADRTGPFPSGDSSITKSNPQWLWQKLLGSEEFRIRVGDRIQKHFFNGGPLSAEGARALYLRRRDQISTAVIAESARWGDAKRPSAPFTQADWQSAVNQNLNFISRRSPIVLNQLRVDGLVSSVEAPQFNQQGGAVNPGFGLLMAPPNATIFYTLDGTDPRAPGGSVAPGARQYTGPVVLNESVPVKARARSGTVWSAVNEAEFVLIQTFTNLFITEIHYHPAASGGTDGDEFEFLELKNVGSETLDLSGVRFTQGITFEFARGTRLAPGAFAVLVGNPEGFAQRYPGRAVAGTYSGRLSNSGERLTMVHAVGTPLFSVAYDTRPPWPQSTDGQGFSLVPVQPNANPVPDAAGNWRASSQVGGSPGADDPVAGIVPVLVNEILTHTDPPLVDAVEFYNPNAVAAPIGHWWLSDNRAEPRKYRIPAGVEIPAGGYFTLSELEFNRPLDGPGTFTFSSYGDDVWLSSGNAAGELTGYSDGFAFDAAENAATFGRFTNSIGEISYPTQVRNTLGEPNSGPRLGPVVLNEIHFQPTAGGLEFVELRNISDSPVPLFDPVAPTNTWEIAGIGFRFPAGVVLPPGGLAVVAGSTVESFRSRYGVPEEVPVFGPFTGTLQDNGETLALTRPDKPDLQLDGSYFVPRLTVDSVRYRASAPWPTAAAGGGASLERRSPVAYADDPAAWRASVGEPSPGVENDGNRPPAVDAGAGRQLEATRFPVEVSLQGSATDDGLPLVPGRLALEWAQVRGPGPAVITTPTAASTGVRLPGTGEFVFRLTASDGERSRSDEVVVTVGRPAERQNLVVAGATWRYLDDGTDQGTSWRDPAFNDAAWQSGPAKLGFGDGNEQTTLRRSAGGPATITFYFRHAFDLADPASVTGLRVFLVRDDGAMVYLNNQLVFRSNMPEGEVTAATVASEVVGNDAESAFFEQALDPAVLRSGRNVLAVEVHQQNANSSDLGFDLRLEGDVSASNRPPLVDAGPDLQGEVGVPVSLSATFQDDALPNPPGVALLEWRQMEGPGAAVIADPTGPMTSVIFPMPGRYVLRAAVYDGATEVRDDVEAVITGSGDEYTVWLARYFTAAELADPLVSGENADPDGDGLRNRDEFQAGTDPRDARSALRVDALVETSGEVRLRLRVVTGKSYSVQARDSVSEGTWTTVQSIESATCDCEVEVADPGGSTGGARFYRVVTPRQ